jgi:energy-coupling factor transporter ATP-binding protein EcfA2
MLGLDKYLQPETINPESKKENELNTEDRMFLLNKKIDENFLMETYENLINHNQYIKNDKIVKVNEYVFNDIELLHDHYLNTENGLFSKLDKCHTKFGSILLKNILLKPIYDIEVLQMRQNIFQKIGSVHEKINPILVEIKELEKDLVWFWNDANNKHIELMNDLIYFNYDIIPFFNLNDVLNNNEKALLITNIYKIIVSPILTIVTPLLSLIIPLVFLYYMNSKAKLNIPMGVVLKQYFQTLFSSDSMKVIFKSPTKAFLASMVTKGIYLFMYFQNIYYSIQSSSNTHKIINIIHEKLNKMNKYIQLTQQIKNICGEVGVIDLSSYIQYTKIKEDLLFYDDYFQFPVFNSDPSLFSNKGKILCTFKKFKKNKDSAVNIFHYTGIIDAVLSISEIIRNSTKENPYCITNYYEKKTPTLLVENIWHPYLDKATVEKAVKNSIDIKNNILITGPNAAGKSTFIKSVIINILLSQTIGINSATKFEMTPFRLIETYLHIPDNKGSTSLFEAEMFRSKEYIDKIKNLDKDHFSFIVLDEIFSSTNYVEGFSGAYSILKKISSFSNTLSITTTHYTDLDILEKDTKGKIKNYKFEVDHDENNEIIFNYKLKKGTSRQYIALELLKKNGFDEDVIEGAINICQKIKDKKLIFFKKRKDNKIDNKIEKI